MSKKKCRKMITCKVCGKMAENHGGQLCSTHYHKCRYQVRTKGLTWPQAIEYLKNPPPKPLCSTDGCNEPVKAKGMCESHYLKAFRSKKLKTKKRTPKRDVSKIIDNIFDDDTWALTSFWADTVQEDTRTIDEYMSDRYDKELMKAIKHYYKTGEVIDTCQ